MGKPNFAIVGTGTMAMTMVPIFAHAGAQVVAVCSRERSRAQQFASSFRIPTAETDLCKLFERNDIDAVYIANAPRDHALTAIAALKAGKPVLCEKPMGISVGEAELIARTAQNANVLCMEGLWTLFLPAYRRLFELVGDPNSGIARNLVADFGYPTSEQLQPQLFASIGGGVLLDRMIYLISLALKVLGDVETTQALVHRTTTGIDVRASLQLRHLGGGFSQLSASFETRTSNTATVASTKRLVCLEAPLIGCERISIKDAEPPQSGSSINASSMRRLLVETLRQNPPLRRLKAAMSRSPNEDHSYGTSQYLPQLRHFLALLRSNAKESDIASLTHSLAVHKIIDIARASAI